MPILRRLDWLVIAALTLAAVLLLRSNGALAPLEHRLDDARAGLLQHEVDSDIVIIGIDQHSLDDLQQWPWPRRRHAELLQRLNQAGARRLFIDIDFSTPSNPEDDSALANALAAWRDTRPVLPVFFQQASGAGSELLITRPLPQLAKHATLAVVNVRPDADGLVRQGPDSWRDSSQSLPSVVEATTDPMTRSPLTTRAIDYSIAPSSFTYFSYSDVLRNRIPDSEFAGKTVYVGATAVELRDLLPVPRYRALPGVEVLALARQTAAAGGIAAPPPWLSMTLLVAWSALGAALLRGWGWRRNVLVLLGAVVFGAAAGIYSYSHYRISLELAPILASSVLLFLCTTLRSLDEQTLRALLYKIGIQRRDALLNSIIESSADCIVCIDQHGIIQMANPAALRLFAANATALSGAQVGLFMPTVAERCRVMDSVGTEPPASSVCESDARDIEGNTFPVEVSISRVWQNEEKLYTAIVRDIRERMAHQRALEYQASHDDLTALPNRSALTAHFQTLLADVRLDRSIALLMLDLCRFKEVNDTLGHDVGDLVLKEVARRFKNELSEDAFIARLGGDEFAVVLDQSTGERNAAEVAARLSGSLRSAITVGGVPIDVGVNIGIALSPQDASDAQTLLRHADVAMYEAKRHGSPHEYYDARFNEHSVRRLSMVSELRNAIANRSIAVWYQPQMNLRTNQVDCVEALLRWRHPTFGNVSPTEFVGMAETTDLIWPLTEWTLTEALGQMVAWRDSGLEVRVAVNVSARVLQDNAFPERLGALLSEYGIAGRWLELEITESAMLSDPPKALAVIKHIHEFGVQISIDDFGTGFSSLSYLRDLPVHALKLDKSFVIDMQSREDNRVIVQSTAQMARALNIRIVGEGVETRWHADQLFAFGYDYGQGYYFSAALPADACELWMRKRRGMEASVDAA